MSRIFLSLHPFYEGGDIFGRKLANSGFMNALFRRDYFDMYHFFVDNPHDLIQKWHDLPDAQPLLKRGALQAFPRTHLQKRLQLVPYTVCHFSDPMTEIAAMCHARNTFAPHIFPITAVNHTISYIEYAKSTLGHIWKGCTPRDGIGCTSEASRTIMQSWYTHARKARALTEDWHNPQLKVIPLGVPDPELGNQQNLRQGLRQRLGLAENTALILLYGRVSLVDKMDVRPFFSALRRIRTKYPQLSFSFYVAGSMDDDSLKEQMQELAKTWDIPFTISPNPSRELKKELFAAADIFVSPTDNIQETFGLTLVEAAQAGLPVIASDWNGYKDIVVSEQTGILVPTLAPTDTPDLDTIAGVLFNKIHQLLRSQQTALHVPYLENALYRLISQPNVRKEMGQKAKERAAKLYTFDAVVEGWIEFWQELQNTPISAEQEAQLRGEKHPYALDFGKTFSAYASHRLHKENVLSITELGIACLHKQAPWNNYALAAVNMTESLIRHLLEQTLQGCTVEELLAKAQAAPWGKKYSQEVLFTHIYWLMKQDLVETSL